jgi:hypothetical protein
LKRARFFNDGSSYELIHWINEGQRAIGREFASWHNNEIIVPTLEGQHIASPGDWIIAAWPVSTTPASRRFSAPRI